MLLAWSTPSWPAAVCLWCCTHLDMLHEHCTALELGGKSEACTYRLAPIAVNVVEKVAKQDAVLLT